MKCHSCGSADLEGFYEARSIPVHSCLMVSSVEEARAFPRGDLSLAVCHGCGFVQNTEFDPGVHDYSPDYEETQAFSPYFQRFCTELCDRQIEKHDLRGKTALEIGCGKGEFLVELCERGDMRGIGIDPGYRPERTRSAAAERLEFIQDFYSEKYAYLRADYVCCRHTLEHIQPVREFVQLVRRAIGDRPETTVFFELPDFERVLEEQAFWDIYYEHCSYFTLGSLARLFRACGFEILDLYKAYADQYLMIEMRPNGAPGSTFAAEDDLAATLRGVARFKEAIGRRLDGLRADVQRIRDAGEKAVLWGSGSKAVSYVTTLGLADELEYVVDINPHKHGKFLAGSGHEIVGPEFLRSYRPEHVIVMNPVYCDEIRRDLSNLGVEATVTAIGGHTSRGLPRL